MLALGNLVDVLSCSWVRGTEPQDLASAIMDVMQSENLRVRLGQAGLVRSEQFTLRLAVKAVEILHLGLIEKKSRRVKQWCQRF